MVTPTQASVHVTSLRCNWSPALEGVNGPSRLVAVVKMKHVVFGWMVRIFIWQEEQKEAWMEI